MFKTIKTSTLAIIMIGSAMLVQAQKKINEGELVYTVEYQLKPDQQQMAASLPKEQKTIFNGLISKMDVQQGLFNMQFVTDNGKRESIMLMDIPSIQKKIAVNLGSEIIDQQQKAFGNIKSVKASGEKQKIGAYNAEKYICTDSAGVTSEVWATKDIVLPKVASNALIKDLDAVLVKYTGSYPGDIKTTLTLKMVNKTKVGTALSMNIPAGYSKISKEELGQLMQLAQSGDKK